MAEEELDLSAEIEEHLYKVLVVGDFGVGESQWRSGTPLLISYVLQTYNSIVYTYSWDCCWGFSYASTVATCAVYVCMYTGALTDLDYNYSLSLSLSLLHSFSSLCCAVLTVPLSICHSCTLHLIKGKVSCLNRAVVYHYWYCSLFTPSLVYTDFHHQEIYWR